LRLSDVKIGHVYYVDYEPVRNGEFNGKHLSVVLKRNNDKCTFVVMPLTSSANGDGVNKKNMGKIAGLPPNLHSRDSYAVYNQVRTVNANRFNSIKSGGNSIDVPLDNAIWLELFGLAMQDIVFNLGHDDRISVMKNAYDCERFNKAKDLAYTIIKLRKTGTPKVEEIALLITEIRETLKDVSYTLDAAQTADGLQKIFDEAMKL
jgi:mRNA-degrading endonuclease toxin of MazEF toxin-antitoxin module